MLKNVRRIGWDDVTEAIPAFLTMVIMPFTFSITEGIAFGFISYALLKAVTGRYREVHWLVYLFAALFVLRYALLVRSGA
jgi:AGZA family xanthine/uracil permease-like MFS transporter